MSVDKKTGPGQAKEAGDGKRQYSTPRLTEYGSVAKLTQGTLTVQQDSPAGVTWKKASCL